MSITYTAFATYGVFDLKGTLSARMIEYKWAIARISCAPPVLHYTMDR